MKLRDVLGKITVNKKNGQLNTNLKKNKLKEIGLSKEDFLDMNVDSKLKKIMMENF